jgi:hypothetical protein
VLRDVVVIDLTRFCRDASAGRNLITVFSTVNSLAQIFSHPALERIPIVAWPLRAARWRSMHASRDMIFRIVKKRRVLCSLVTSRLHAMQCMPVARAIRHYLSPTRSRGARPRKIFSADTALCASHKLICAKLRKQFSDADAHARHVGQ